MIGIKGLYILPAIAVVAGVSLLGISTVHAQTTGSLSPTLVETLATRFNLSTSDVQKVFDEHRAQKQQAMQQKFEERLSTAVTEGTITEAQRQALLRKHEEMKTVHEQLKNLTPEERRAKAQALHADFLAFIQANNLSEETLRTLGMGMFGRGFKMEFHMRHGMKP